MKKPDISKMTLREKIAQTLIVRQCDLMMHADTAYSTLRAPEEAVELMEKNQFGGLWVHGNTDVNQMGTDLYASFKFTTDSYLEWGKKLDAVAKVPILFAGDAGKFLSDLSSIFYGLIIGAANDEEASFEYGRCMANEHRTYGMNWLWSPMVDMVSRFTSGILRPYSGDKDVLIRHATAVMKGIQSAGLAASAKHFPGQDPKETRDSHIVPTYMRTSYEDWKKNQGAVFQSLIDSGVDAIMSAARAFPAVDDTKVGEKYLLATFSKKILIDLLKGEMGFEGVVITDDVNMGGYTSFYPKEDLYIEFLRAGNDMLLGVGVDAVDLIERGVMDGRLSEERIDDACRRVLNLKEKVGLFDDSYKRGDINLKEVQPETQKMLKNIATKGLTLVRNEGEMLPLSKDKIKNVRIICYTHREAIFDNLDAMVEAFEKRGVHATKQRRLSSWEEIQKISDENDLIVYVGYIGFHAPKGAPSFYDEEQWSFRYAFTAGKEKSVGVSLGYPFIHHDFMVEAPAFINAYNPAPAVQEAFVAALFGENPITGVSPVDLNMD